MRVSAVTDPACFDVGLRKLLGDFAALYGERQLHDPAWVRDQCRQLSEQFARACHVRGIPAEVVSGLMHGEDPVFGEPVIVVGHYAVEVLTRQDLAGWSAPVVVDWSARQHDPEAAVPEISAPETWRERWRTP